MARLCRDRDVESLALWEISQEGHEVKDIPIQIHTVIVCANGLLVLGLNSDLWEADIKYWVPKQRKAFSVLYDHLDQALQKRLSSIPSIFFSAVDKIGREVEFITENKIKCGLFYEQTSNGNDKFILSVLDN